MFADRSQNLGIAYFCAAEMRMFCCFLLTNSNILTVPACNPATTFECQLRHKRVHLGRFFLHPVRAGHWTVGHCRKSINGKYRNFEVFQKASELGGKVIEARKKSLHSKGLSHEIDLTFNDMYN
jgi:hypothetical protein